MHTVSLLLLTTACTTNLYTEQNYYVEPVEPEDSGELVTVPEGRTFENVDGAPDINAAVAEMTVDPFGNDGNLYWFSVTDDQVAAMNDAWGAYGGSYYYEPGNADPYADHLVVADALTGDVADYGKVQVSIVGESTGMTWTAKNIPNLSTDVDEFQDDLRIGGLEHLRLNNGMVSSIFREALALEIFRALNYPAARTAFAWAGGSVWGADVRIPYTVVESYHKEGFCEDHADALGGGCANLWEGAGGIESLGAQCQEKICDNARYDMLIQIMTDNPRTVFTATTDFIDWPMVQQHMCLDWILWIGDDPFHNNNNSVLAEGMDGKFRFFPYSTDISAGQQWYQNTSLYGSSKLATACARDETCWAQTIATCEVTIDAFQALDPAHRVDEVYNRLSTQGMLRDGDDLTYAELQAWYTARAAEGALETELEDYRESKAPPGGT